MKLGQLEGTKEEITGFVIDNGLDASAFFKMPEEPINAAWIFIPAIFIFIVFVLLTLVHSFSEAERLFIFIIGCAAVTALATVVQLRFESAWASTIVGFGLLLLMLVALGSISPVEMLNEIKSIRK